MAGEDADAWLEAEIQRQLAELTEDVSDKADDDSPESVVEEEQEVRVYRFYLIWFQYVHHDCS